jgi:hypothetical protein
MPSQRDSLSEKLEKIKQSAQKLPPAAAKLNSATDELGKAIANLDGVLKKFNLGIPTWVTFGEGPGMPDEHYWAEEIGYSKINGKWGIAIRTISGDLRFPDDERVEQWLFNDAPRLLRMHSVAKIPELLEAIAEAAAKMTAAISEKTEEVAMYAKEFKGALNSLEYAPPPTPPGVVPVLAQGIKAQERK